MRSSTAAAVSLFSAIKWSLAALALLLLFNALFTTGFFALEIRDGRMYGVLVDILNHGSKVAIVAIGMTLVIATGGVDLSVGAVVAIAGAVAAQLVAGAHPTPTVAAIGTALGVALIAGLWNGVLVVFLRLQPIVATLILMVAGRGVAQLITGGLIITYNDPLLSSIGNGSLVGLPVPVTLLLVLLCATAIATRRSSLGLFIETVGDNQTAARLAGVNDRAIRLVVYAFCGFCAGVAGLIDCSYIRAADANNAGQLIELDAILAVVIGGTSLTGGRFILVGSVVGAMLMQALTQTLYMQNVSADVAPAPKALAVLLVCVLQSPTLRARLASWRRRGP